MTKHNKLPVLWFFLGFGIFMFSRASRVIPFIIPSGIAMIIAPIFILGFIRSQTTKRGILLTFLGFLLSLNIALW
jgi:apolipoprotein N-acyltransferase